MDERRKVIKAIHIGLMVANFFLNTSRILKAIELCKECLFILKTRAAVIKDKKIAKTICKALYSSFVKAQQKILYMDERRKVIKAIHIGLMVANFFLNTSRILKAIELCKECLFILKTRAAVIKDEKIAKTIYKALYSSFVKAYCLSLDCANAIKYGRKLLHIHKECGTKLEESWMSTKLATLYLSQSKYAEAKELSEKALVISKEIGDKSGEALCYRNLGNVYMSDGEYKKARELFEKSLSINKQIDERYEEAWCYRDLGNLLIFLKDYVQAKGCFEKALFINKNIAWKERKAFQLAGARNLEACCYGGLGTVYESVGENEKAREYHERALAITKEIGDTKGEATCYRNLEIFFRTAGEHKKAKEYHQRALAIAKEIGDRRGEAYGYGGLGTTFHSVGDYEKAREYYKKSLAIGKEIGDRNGEAICYGNLGTLYVSVGEYEMGREHLEKSLTIINEIGDRNLEASCHTNLGIAHRSVGEYGKAKKHQERALAIMKEIGERHGEAVGYGNLGILFQCVGKYEKAKEYYEKALAIIKEIGDKKGEASCYGNLGTLFESLGEYEKAREYYERALAINKEIGDRHEEALRYGNLGNLFQCVGEYERAEEYHLKALAINKKVGDRRLEAACYEYLGMLFQTLGKYADANRYYQKALIIRKEIGDRPGEASVHGNLGVLSLSLGDYDRAKECHEKALVIRKGIHDRKGEALDYLNQGNVFLFLGEYDKAEEYYKEGLSISEKIGDVRKQFSLLCRLASIELVREKTQEALSYYFSGIQKYEELFGFLRKNDQFKISFTDKHASPYWVLSALFCDAGNFKEALYASELGRARALADLMSAQYSLEHQISGNPKTWAGIEKAMDNERNCTCLYVSYFFKSIFLWIVKASRVIHFRKINGNERIVQEGFAGNLDDFFASESFRSFGISSKELYEDRSLNFTQTESKPCEEQNSLGEDLRIGKESKDNRGPKMNLPLCYELIIAPVVGLLEDPEIIIVPDRSLYNIPFAALPDKHGKYLSETFRIRVAPSLTTLKLIHESPAHYHSQTGALIVGNPDVGKVHLRGRLTDISRLPCAEDEAKIVGEKLGVKPLLGQQATKEAVLEVINSASLIHFAAHGDVKRGEIALAPAPRIPNVIPQEEHYLLKMSDISKVQLRAKLVVLSCCHSARGQIRAEGVVGIARAFLGSGARSVLVSLWALEDSATKQFMSHFYDHLVCGKSASESLHEAMKWMRSNGFSDVGQWAPFMLIGDNVTFDFEKLRPYSP